MAATTLKPAAAPRIGDAMLCCLLGAAAIAAAPIPLRERLAGRAQEWLGGRRLMPLAALAGLPVLLVAAHCLVLPALAAPSHSDQAALLSPTSICGRLHTPPLP